MLENFNLNILVVGVGGLGCELLKYLVLEGFRFIGICDPDIIESSNLNRQFLFRTNDIGRYKVSAARDSLQYFIEDRSLSIKIYVSRIEELAIDEILQYDRICSTVDSLECRRWVNMMVCQNWNNNLHHNDCNDFLFVDGGSQSLYGHVRVIQPGVTPCLECNLGIFSSTNPMSSCSLTHFPQNAEDCISEHAIQNFGHLRTDYVVNIMWDIVYPHMMLNYNCEEVLNWIYDRALEYSKDIGVQNLTRDLVEWTVKGFVPNIATTNSVIAALMTNVLLQPIGAACHWNFYFYTGYGITCIDRFNLLINEDCTLCNCFLMNIKIKRTLPFKTFIDMISTDLSLLHTSISSNKGIVYISRPSCIQGLYAHRLNQTIKDLEEYMGTTLYITATGRANTYIVKLNIED